MAVQCMFLFITNKSVMTFLYVNKIFGFLNETELVLTGLLAAWMRPILVPGFLPLYLVVEYERLKVICSTDQERSLV